MGYHQHLRLWERRPLGNHVPGTKLTQRQALKNIVNQNIGYGIRNSWIKKLSLSILTVNLGKILSVSKFHLQSRMIRIEQVVTI